MPATTEELKVTCPNGKIVKWTGKEIASGEWPEGINQTGYSITVYETAGGKLVASIYNADENCNDVVIAPTQGFLISGLRNHEWAQNDDFMAALQNAFPEEEIWCEEIE